MKNRILLAMSKNLDKNLLQKRLLSAFSYEEDYDILKTNAEEEISFYKSTIDKVENAMNNAKQTIWSGKMINMIMNELEDVKPHFKQIDMMVQSMDK